jgi:hypothetical protein
MTETILHFEESGRRDGDVFVFLHGFMGNCRSLKTIINALAGIIAASPSICPVMAIPSSAGPILYRP